MFQLCFFTDSILFPKDQGECSRRNFLLESNDADRLLFHINCGAHAVVTNGGLTAHRPRFILN